MYITTIWCTKYYYMAFLNLVFTIFFPKKKQCHCFYCFVVPLLDISPFLCVPFVHITQIFYCHFLSLECICWPFSWLLLIFHSFKINTCICWNLPFYKSGKKKKWPQNLSLGNFYLIICITPLYFVFSFYLIWYRISKIYLVVTFFLKLFFPILPLSLTTI